MSTSAHVVIEFGKNRIELYRHWGGDLEITGDDLLQKIIDAPESKERVHFHDGGYVLKLLLADSDGSLPQYQIVDGKMGESWEHGYHLRYLENEEIPEKTTIDLGDGPITFTNTDEVSVVGQCQGEWEISYSEIDESDTLEDWLPHAEKFSVQEFNDFVNKSADEAIRTDKISDLDARDAYLSRFKKNKD